jgi:hypothetical protein
MEANTVTSSGDAADVAPSGIANSPANPQAQVREEQTEQQRDQPVSKRAHRPAGERAVLKHGRSSLVSDIRTAVTTKYNEIFMLVSQSGDILANNSGLGLYYRDTCYLDRLELRVAGEHGIPLLADASAGRECHFEMTNGDIYLDDG